MNEFYSYQDIFLIPEYSDLHSRDEANTKVKFGPREFRLPVVPANMKCVIDSNIAKWCSANDYFYIMHRFNKHDADAPNHDNWEFLEMANAENWKTISISLGVQNYDREFILEAVKREFRIDYLNVDIAHGNSIKMKEMLEFLCEGLYRERSESDRRGRKPFIIAGNVATPEAVVDLENWGADATKCGISAGHACSTFGMTGFGLPMFSCVLDCAAVAKKPIIADGGIRTNGDIAKAIRAGGTMVMAGSVFAACKDAPGETITKLVDTGEWEPSITIGKGTKWPVVFPKQIILKEKDYKVYFGSASEQNKHTKRHVEGTRVELPCNGKTYAEKYQEIADSYSSSISYAGGNLANVKWGVKKS